MHDFLSELESKGKTVNRIGRGIIASSATYILMGKNSRMTKNSWAMIHNVSGGIWGDVDTVERFAVTLRKFNNRSRDFYSEWTGIRKEEISKMMDNETWMTADEAKSKGFVIDVVESQNFTQKIPKENWQFSNMTVLNAYNNNVNPTPEDQKNPMTRTGKILMIKNSNEFDIVKAIDLHKCSDEDLNKLHTIVSNQKKGIGRSASEWQFVNDMKEKKSNYNPVGKFS